MANIMSLQPYCLTKYQDVVSFVCILLLLLHSVAWSLYSQLDLTNRQEL